MKVDHLSASRIETYLRCPHQYYVIYELGKSQESIPMTFGTLLHDVLEEVFKSDGDIDPLEIYKQKWPLYNLRDLSYFKLGRDLLQEFFANNDYSELKSMIFDVPEREFQINILDGEESIPIVGRIDLILRRNSETLEVIDFKTSVVPKSTSQLEQDIQMGIYYLVVGKYLFPGQVKKIILTLYFLRYNRPVSITLEVSDDQFKLYEDYLTSVYNQILHDDTHVATPNFFCPQCTESLVCEAFRNTSLFDLSTVSKENTPDLKTLLEEYDTIERQIRLLKQRKDYIEQIFEFILTSSDKTKMDMYDRTIEILSPPSTSYDVKKCFEVLTLDEFLQVASVGKKKVDDLLKDDPDRLGKIASCAKVEYNTPYVKISAPKKIKSSKKK